MNTKYLRELVEQYRACKDTHEILLNLEGEAINMAILKLAKEKSDIVNELLEAVMR